MLHLPACLPVVTRAPASPAAFRMANMYVTVSQQQNRDLMMSAALINHADLSEPWPAVSGLMLYDDEADCTSSTRMSDLLRLWLYRQALLLPCAVLKLCSDLTGPCCVFISVECL
jgi:hypothetical protein